MAFLLAKKLSHSLQLHTPHHHLTLVIPLLHLSTKAPQTKDLPFIAEYLISSFGFSPDRALRIATTSSYLSPIKTPDRPEAVVSCLKETGLTDSQIKSLISWAPRLLSLSVPKIVEPHLCRLMDAGFTGDGLIRLIRNSPSVLYTKPAISRLQFWRNYTGNDVDVLKIISRNSRILQLDIDNVVQPSIKLLKDYGLSDADVRRLWLSACSESLKSPDSIKKLIEDTEAFGFARKSRTFLLALPVVSRCNGDTIVKKLTFLKNSYGCSEEEVQTAFKKFPNLVTLSENMLKSKMDFLLGSAGVTKSYILSRPALLGYSLEKRLVPRHHVLSVLKIKGLNEGTGFYGAVTLSEKDFLEKFVMPYKEVPELEELYAAACRGKISI